MANYVYKGSPTYGASTKDIKIPLSDGSFLIFDNVLPNVTQITVNDSKAIEYCDKNINFEKVS